MLSAGVTHDSWISRVLALIYLGACMQAAPNESSVVSPVSPSPNDQAAFFFFVDRGFSDIQAAGIVGNLDQESNVNPRSVQPSGPGRRIARGSDHHLVTLWQTSPGSGFDGFADLGGPINADPAIGQRPDGIKAAFLRTPDGSILTTWQDTPASAFRASWSFLYSQ